MVCRGIACFGLRKATSCLDRNRLPWKDLECVAVLSQRGDGGHFALKCSHLPAFAEYHFYIFDEPK